MRRSFLKLILVLAAVGTMFLFPSPPIYGECVPMRDCITDDYAPMICYKDDGERVYDNICLAHFDCASGCRPLFPE